ncbi:hypothetical protein COU02_00870 [bacterium (Candidatus Gribaldobacteria) CG10_big_fil_rev_8_21_14_0_10_37_46]|uniref:Small-conductance mechanosensitive ion channel n=1 Tax=bacterium (Candidatus Gribaldobacteria) CG10_big_fil_rev_8_21_14_0_10_37_46 TaxID=2014276 RepID=A0A2H0UWL0_9BACT|nr:MAG: hypothetical protein COU02_00870 [bacterium (Candidatus Gribaldobacteria) CG10_big_fil_rev_8_21_14_0_10_37_46]
MMIEDWSGITLLALQDFWQGFLNFMPRLIGAIVILLIGWFIADWIGKLITEILKRLKFDRIFERTQWQDALEKAEFKVSVSHFFGEVVQWILVIVFLLAAVEVLGSSQFAIFLNKIVNWLPNLVVSVAIFVVAIIIADFAKKIIQEVVEKAKVGYSGLIASIVQWAIWIFALFVILIQLGIAKELIQILFTGLIGLIVISWGIAFGLGGKDLAKDILEGIRNKLKK